MSEVPAHAMNTERAATIVAILLSLFTVVFAAGNRDNRLSVTETTIKELIQKVDKLGDEVNGLRVDMATERSADRKSRAAERPAK